MKKFFLFATLFALGAGTASEALAQPFTNQASQAVNINVQAVNRIKITGDDVLLTIGDADPGSTDLLQATHSTSFYSITSNKPNQRLTAQITTGSLDAGLTLYLSVTVPGGRGTTAGEQNITNTANAYDLINAIPKGATSIQAINYRLTATSEVEPYTSGPKQVTVTWTLQD